ncbi:hypothetical protein KSP40_PGU015619 [Platanthera guangdongensis]|uniref:Uncharacterized protein n=1 Tax=Platanthera guangdongensis TaxID=2320717 RepID=A0ABR2MKB5_9ASPA
MSVCFRACDWVADAYARGALLSAQSAIVMLSGWRYPSYLTSVTTPSNNRLSNDLKNASSEHCSSFRKSQTPQSTLLTDDDYCLSLTKQMRLCWLQEKLRKVCSMRLDYADILI